MTHSRILFLDIDGTILAADHTIQQSTIDAIAQIKDQGIEVFIATGRPLHEIDDIQKQVNVDSAIGYNGAYAIHHGEIIFHQTINPDLVNHFTKTANKHGHELVLYRDDATLFTGMSSPIAKRFIDYFELKHNRPYETSDSDHILGITFIDLPVNDHKYYQSDDLFLSQANIPGLKGSYDVIQNGINKGVAIQHILEQLNLDPKEAISFGDGLNDREMLSFIETSFAMANSHPDLFQYAKYRTTSVDEDGVFNGLKQLGLVK